jgi:hypothetical protein
LQESVIEWFACPTGKQIGQVIPYNVSMYLRTHVGLTWDWVQDWIHLYIVQAQKGSAYNMAAAFTAKEQAEKEEHKLYLEATAAAVKDYPNVCPARKLPKRLLLDRVAKTSLASCLTEPSVMPPHHPLPWMMLLPR